MRVLFCFNDLEIFLKKCIREWEEEGIINYQLSIINVKIAYSDIVHCSLFIVHPPLVHETQYI